MSLFISIIIIFIIIIKLVEMGFEFFHNLGVPYLFTIVGAAIVIRVLMLPVIVTQTRIGLKVTKLIMPECKYDFNSLYFQFVCNRK
jgi:hypothetical protein